MKVLFQTSINYRTFRQHDLHQYIDSVGQNTGNLMFTTSIQWMLEESNVEVIIDHVPWQDLASYINCNEITHVIVNCSNWIRPSNVGLLGKVVDALREVTCPTYFVGLGVNATLKEYKEKCFGSLEVLEPIVKELIELVDRSSGAIGLRGLYSKAYFDSVSISDRVRVTGCPSICMFGAFPKSINEPLPQHIGSVILNGHHMLENLSGLRLGASEYEFVCQDWAIAPLLFPGEMQKSDWRRMLQLDTGVLELFSKDRVKIFDSVDAWSHYLTQGADCVVGTRIHGGLIALFSGIPTLFLNWDSRLAELTEFYGLPSVDFDDWDGSVDLIRDYDWTGLDNRFTKARLAFNDFFTDFDIPIRCGVKPNVGRSSTRIHRDMQRFALGAIKVPGFAREHRVLRAIIAEYLRG